MKTVLKSLALVFAAGFPGVLAAQFAGASVPASVDATLFAGFGVSCLLITLAADYGRRGLVRAGGQSGSLVRFAREERRLAA